MLSKDLEKTISQAHRNARSERHEYLTTEHLLLALLDNPSAKITLEECEADVETLRTDLINVISREVPKIIEGNMQEIRTTMSFQRVIQRAIFYAQSVGRSAIEGVHVLMAILSEKETFSAYFLMRQNIAKNDVMNVIRQSILQSQLVESVKVSLKTQQAQPEKNLHEEDKTDDSILARYATNLNNAALAGDLDRLIGREHEMMRLVQILCRRNKNNPLLIGDAGVGKTSIVEGLAIKLIEGAVPAELKCDEIYQLDIASLVAGTKFRGDFEKRMKALLAELSERPNVIIFIDEIHSIIGAGSTSGHSLDASSLLKPLLTKGKIRIIGATTHQEFRNIFEKDIALTRRFQKIEVNEPSISECIEMLKGLTPNFEQYHGVSYSPRAIETAVQLSARFINDRFLPDKAFDVLDEAGAFQKIRALDERKRLISEEEIEAVVSRIARVPIVSLSKNDLDVLLDLENILKKNIIGQDHVIKTVVDVIKFSKSGLGEPTKPIASFLFSGPTGVGKTTLSQQLAQSLSIPLIRFDMSEYMEKHSVARFIGAPPGYVGYDQPGLLTNAVLKSPYGVLLLDEIDKAHPDVLNLMLQVMDYARLSDSTGRQVDFRNIILIMTTNSGARSFERTQIGFSHPENMSVLESKEAIERDFSPEFRNRIDAILEFKPLTKQNMLLIIEQHVDILIQQLVERNITLHVTTTLKKWLAEVGFDRHMGARPMKKTINNYIKKPLSEAILFGSLKNGGQVTFDHDGEKVITTYTQQCVVISE